MCTRYKRQGSSDSMDSIANLSSDARAIYDGALVAINFKTFAAKRNVNISSIEPLNGVLSEDTTVKDVMRTRGLLAASDVVTMLSKPQINYTEKETAILTMVLKLSRELLKESTALVAPIVSTFRAATNECSKSLLKTWIKGQCDEGDTFERMITLMVYQVMAFRTTGKSKELVIERADWSVFKSFRRVDIRRESGIDSIVKFFATNTSEGLHFPGLGDWTIAIGHKLSKTQQSWNLSVMYGKNKEYINELALVNPHISADVIVSIWKRDDPFTAAKQHDCTLWLKSPEERVSFWEVFWGGEGQFAEKSHLQYIMGARLFIDVAKGSGVRI